MHEPTVEDLKRCLDASGTPVPDSVLPGLLRYVLLLLRWNRIMNLVGTRNFGETVRELVSDCVRLVPFIEGLALPASPLIWDLGAGAGLPGIPLRLLWQAGDYVLVEKRQKRAMFLSQVRGTLHLEHTEVFSGDARDLFAKGNRADLVISRAFMPWEKLLEFVRESLKGNGVVVFMANEPLDRSRIPDGYLFHAETSYRSGSGKRRWLWALRRG